MKLAQKTIDALAVPKGKSELIVFDDDLPGFGLRIRSGGARTWIYQFKIGAQHRRMTLGSVAALSVAQARKTAGELQAMVRLGRDPAYEKAEGQTRAAETMGAMLKSYLEQKRETLKPGSYKGVERHLQKHCRRLHTLQLAKIDRRAVASTITAVASGSGPVEANRVRASLSAFFAWCIGEGLLDNNPATGTGRRPERSRDRVLTDAELKVIWEATAGEEDYSAVVRLLILTGARANEIASLTRSEVLDDRIVLSAERTKNGRAHSIPMSEPVRVILGARLQCNGEEFLFGRRHGRPLSGWSRLKASLAKRIQGLTDWTHHDLRRTFATKLAELGVAPHIIEALLNHVSGHKHGVAGVYNRADYETQKRQALNLWAEHIMALVEGRTSKLAPLVKHT